MRLRRNGARPGVKVLFDHCVPRPFRRSLPGCHISTAREAGLDAVANGELFTAAEGQFAVLITSDQNLRHQQNLRSRKLAIIVLPTFTATGAIAI